MEEHYRFTTPEEATRAEVDYWLSVPIEERISAVERIRRATLGIYDGATPRLERVYSLVVLKRRCSSPRKKK